MAIQHTITQNPEFALITVQLQAGQKIYSEPGAMASMDDNIKLTASLQGGVLSSIKRSLGGESLISTYEAEGKSGEPTLVAGQPGDTTIMQWMEHVNFCYNVVPILHTVMELNFLVLGKVLKDSFLVKE